MLCFSVAVECVSSLAVDSILQMHFLQSGVLWHLLLTLFEYDHTLEESGVENVEGGSNKQFVANNLAKLAVRAQQDEVRADQVPREAEKARSWWWAQSTSGSTTQTQHLR